MESTALPAPLELPSGRRNRVTERISLFIFWGIHVACLSAIWTGVSARAVAIAIALYWLRMFAITGGYHRYFSHRTYKTSRWFQFALAWLGASSVQKGPLWWAATHRRHHRYSDLPGDVHSPRLHGFWQSHVGWIVGAKHVDTDMQLVKDLARYPELVWLNPFHWVPPVLLAALCYLIAGGSGLVVGFGWSTVALWHGTFTINSLSHLFGRQRFVTGDDSRNNWLLALITMGEGWHNNHHHYMKSVNQGFYWWEIDMSYYLLRGLAAVGLVWDLRRPPVRVLAQANEGTTPAATATASVF